MKREALTHPKMYDLADRLGITRAQAIGILQLLWDFTSSHAPRGDIGKWSDGAIARACDWTSGAAAFVAALVSSGWLDADDEHRLVVHDWPSHCENWVRAKLARLGVSFLPCYHKPVLEPSKDASPEPSYEASYEGSYEASPPRDLPYPTHNPSTTTSPTPSSGRGRGRRESGNGSAVADGTGPGANGTAAAPAVCVDAVRESATAISAAMRTFSQSDRLWLWRCCWLAHAVDAGICDDVRRKLSRREVENPKAYFEAAVRKACEESGVLWRELARGVPPIPDS